MPEWTNHSRVLNTSRMDAALQRLDGMGRMAGMFYKLCKLVAVLLLWVRA